MATILNPTWYKISTRLENTLYYIWYKLVQLLKDEYCFFACSGIIGSLAANMCVDHVGIHARLLTQRTRRKALGRWRLIIVLYSKRSRTSMIHGISKYWASLVTCLLDPKKTSTLLCQR